MERKRGSRFYFPDNKVKKLKSNRSGQISIFVIVAIILVAGIFLYFAVRGKISVGKVPANLQQVENYFLSCIQGESIRGVEILENQGGYIYLPDFVPGSAFMPSSNYLDFLGINIPYWYYVSGNNIVREQVPSKSNMENQLEDYLKENLDCDFSDFEDRGYLIELSEIKADVKILDNKLDVSVRADLNVAFEDDSYRFTNHEQEVSSNLGNMYREARKIYDYEKQTSFLENYSLDVLRLYLPVDGVELSCSPKVWIKTNLDKELKEALEANIQAIRFSYKQGYFNQNLDVKEQVNFLYDREWPTRIETFPANNNVMIAEPVGNQPGLGILGFCYVPYHFVYDIVHPVLIQVFSSGEIFQFPVVAVISGNKVREALPVNSVLDAEPELCKYANTQVSVYTYNTNLEGVEADISFECLGQRCDIGKTKLDEKRDAVLVEKFPSCLNGFITAKAENYVTERHQQSTNIEGDANIILDRLYELDLELRVNGKITNDNAIISFISRKNIQTVAWPEVKSVKLSEGSYNITVYAYRQGKIVIPGMKQEHCSTVPKSGLLGIFGMTEEKCIDVDIPPQELTSVISAGGKSEDYFIENQLVKNKVIVSVQSIPVPASLEQLQDSYNLLEIKQVYVDFE